MRIISQNRMCDYPYEIFTILHIEENVLIKNPFNEKVEVLGTYEDEKEAYKVFHKILEAHVNGCVAVLMPQAGDTDTSIGVKF